jgi:hydroxypyruvate reductase
MHTHYRKQLLELMQAALRAVGGDTCVASYLTGLTSLNESKVASPVYMVAVGKAASAMAQGALQAWGERVVQGLVITKAAHLEYGLQQDSRLTCIEAGHPLPNEASLEAGDLLVSFLQQVPEEGFVLFLISGGTSSLVEMLPTGISLAELHRLNEWLLASGLEISQMNVIRKAVSCIKGGRLPAYMGQQQALALLISDVPGDDVATIGSGLLVASPAEKIRDSGLSGWITELLDKAASGQEGLCARPIGQRRVERAPIQQQIIATNAVAMQGVIEQAHALGHRCTVHEEALHGDALEMGRRVANILLHGDRGVHVWGGETTVQLPATPGHGGRNQSLALSAAIELQEQKGVYLLAVGTDGTDGPGEDAGALVDGDTLVRGRLQGLDATTCLRQADAGTFLAASGDLVHTGPTGTNVMDLVIGLKY